LQNLGSNKKSGLSVSACLQKKRKVGKKDSDLPFVTGQKETGTPASENCFDLREERGLFLCGKTKDRQPSVLEKRI